MEGQKESEEDRGSLLVPVHADPHPLLDVGGRHRVGEVHHELGELLHVDDVPGGGDGHDPQGGGEGEEDGKEDVLGIVAVRVDDLGAARDLGVGVRRTE